jgi:hypothetical protein
MIFFDGVRGFDSVRQWAGGVACLPAPVVLVAV